ncbi:MAG: hypothetical protein UT48_C0006G0016 [Parcubacteria group bacterium GW2011_GWE2_39_37]|uniref:Homeodomain phBC6A51-type domain-containing protein n=1 Tax=Candidatus Falkowbacteria bacterium GW2011_GWF2_39_8 TaxID=1618642 RepID=A0A0G0T7P2_9BACT|nr:MAG: hypothetical protein UT48_C0006G0016 [Parcubacteria group bacterium GW2011_GWE2_39_37]KKR33877.1 MAG: hypothetical protein UT64_C0002G0016 [Candidatus Falkowbacteria bacterium GW2011_GWF2_39_8]
MSLPKARLKKKFIEKAKENPLVSSLCRQLGIGRATYYRWLEEDKIFKADFLKAQKIGQLGICDLAESKIISLVKSEKENVAFGAAKFILHNNSPAYKDFSLSHQRLKYEQRIKHLENENKEIINNALDKIEVIFRDFSKQTEEELPTDKSEPNQT